MSWFVVRTKPNQESRAQENLHNQGFDTYLPMFNYHNKKPEPLFGGYLFLANKPSKEPFSKIRSTRGVISLVRFGNKVALVQDALVSELKQESLCFENLNRFKANELVRINSGPFSQLSGVYLCKSGNDRALILLRWLNRDNKVEIEESKLEKF